MIPCEFCNRFITFGSYERHTTALCPKRPGNALQPKAPSPSDSTDP
jgi:hypothetical protein